MTTQTHTDRWTNTQTEIDRQTDTDRDRLVSMTPMTTLVTIIH